MAIAAGTTSRQVQALARWTVVGLIVVGVSAWGRPSFRAWGGATAGLLAAFALWVMAKTLSADRSVAGHPVYLVLLIPAAVPRSTPIATNFARCSARTFSGPS